MERIKYYMKYWIECNVRTVAKCKNKKMQLNNENVSESNRAYQFSETFSES